MCGSLTADYGTQLNFRRRYFVRFECNGRIGERRLSLHCRSGSGFVFEPHLFTQCQWRTSLDVIVFGLLIGQIIGRWGNFMNREAFGAETDVFCRMGLISPDGTTIYVHPTFLYESLWNLVCLIFLAVWVKAGKRRYDGQCILIYFFWYGIGRAWIEGLRTDSLYIGSTGIRVSQALSMVLALISFILLVVNARRQHKPEELYVNRVAASAAASESPAEETESNKEE